MSAPVRRLSSGDRLGRYEILDLLGAGGMGEVYRARDSQLGREVAVKVLPAELQADPDRVRRFTQEARAASALNHPNILTVHDVGTHDGAPYITTEMVRGQSVRELLASGPLPPERVVDLAAQLAAGLAKAHEAGIVHRDLKPENVMVSEDGFVKILDFGLAKLQETGERLTSTATGGVVGTAGYMSPEQLRGERVDFRADQFSFGAVLYEMATGRQPFRRGSTVDTLAALLNEEPPRMGAVNPAVPAELEQIVARCLAKQPQDRYGSTRDLLRDLERLRGKGVPLERAAPRRRTVALLPVAAVAALAAALLLRGRTGSIDSLAVLPFANAGGDPAMEYLSDGVAESLINILSRLPRLRVMARSAVFRYKGKADDPQKIGAELKVKAVLTGRVVRRGDRLVVGAELVDVATGAVLWGDQYDRSVSDILVLQEEIARQISDHLRLKLSGEEQTRLTRRPTADVAAYEQYLKGGWHLARQTEPDTRAALDAFEAALRIDPRFAEAQAGLAVASAQMGFRFAAEADAPAWQRRVEEAKRRALEMGADLAETHEALAFLYSSSEFDWERTIAEGRRALEINPHLPMSHLYIARAFYHLGLFPETEREVEAGVALDPAYKVEPLRIRGNAALLEGRFEDAVRLLEEALGLGRNASAEWWLGGAYHYAGRREQAEATLQALAGSGQAQAQRRSQATMASLLAARGEQARAHALIDEVTASAYMDHHVAYALGATYAQLGQPAEARRWLAEAARTGFPCYPWYARDSLLEPLRGDPAFQAFLAALQGKWNAARARYARASLTSSRILPAGRYALKAREEAVLGQVGGRELEPLVELLEARALEHQPDAAHEVLVARVGRARACRRPCGAHPE